MKIEGWLARLGLEAYAGAFVAADVDTDTLPDLTEADLAQLGVTLGHRKRILRAIASPDESSETPPHPGPAMGAPGERRQLTILFCDIVGSTALAGTLDAEDVRSVISAFHRLCAEVAAAHAGEVVQYLGDGVMIEFGYPHAHEDDAARAVRCALGLVAAVQGTAFPGGITLSTRVGVATGTEVVGYASDGTLGRASSVGATPSLASRVQNAAEPDTVVIAASTRRLVGGAFELASLGATALKGVAGETELWRVEREVRGTSRFAMRRASEARFVGRELEIALLQHRARLATAGEGQAVLLLAEAGIGKSRIVEQFLESRPADARIIRLQCSPNHTASALFPLSEFVTREANLVASDTSEQSAKKLAALARHEGLAETDADDALALLAGLADAEERPAIRALDLEGRKALVFATLLGAVRTLAAHGSLIVFVEDLHWVDPTTLDFLTQMIDTAADRRVLAIATARPGFVSPWAHFGHLTTLAINRLERSAVEAMIDDLRGTSALPDPIMAEILERADGVPLFVEELTKTILETGATSTLAIPETLRDALAARLDTHDSARDVAQSASVIGREFSLDMLLATSDKDATTLERALEQLIRSGLVMRKSSGAEYSFKHALVRDAAYDTLLRSRRQLLHLRAAAALLERFPAKADAAPEMVAHHLEEAGDRLRAVAYWQSAADLAISRSAYREAAIHLRRGIDGLAKLGERHDDMELALLNKLGTVCFVLEGGASRGALETFERAQPLAELMPESRTTFAAQWGMCLCHIMSGRMREAIPMARRLEASAKRLDSDDLLLEAFHATWSATFGFGDVQSAIAATERGVAIYDPKQHHRHVIDFGSGHDSGVCARGHGAIARILAGRIEEGRSWLGAARQLSDELGHPFSLCIGRQHVGIAHYLLGDFASASASGSESFERAREKNFIMPLHFGKLIMGAAHVAMGDRAGGVAAMKDLLDRPGCAVPITWQPAYLSWLASGEIEEGNLTSAGAHLAVARTLAGSLGGCFAESETGRIEAKLALARGEHWTAVDAHFERALAIARTYGTPLLDVRVLCDRVELLLAHDAALAAHARIELQKTLEKIDGDTPDIERARSLAGATAGAER